MKASGTDTSRRDSGSGEGTNDQWMGSAVNTLGGLGLSVTLLAVLIGATSAVAFVDRLVKAAESYEVKPPPSLRPDRREAVVRHEAGHLFACVLLGLQGAASIPYARLACV